MVDVGIHPRRKACFALRITLAIIRIVTYGLVAVFSVSFVHFLSKAWIQLRIVSRVCGPEAGANVLDQACRPGADYFDVVEAAFNRALSRDCE